MWQDEWPTEPGMWWFYGWRFGKERIGGKNEEPELCLVEVHGTALMYATHGHFLHEESAVGKWQKALLPELPKLTR